MVEKCKIKSEVLIFTGVNRYVAQLFVCSYRYYYNDYSNKMKDTNSPPYLIQSNLDFMVLNPHKLTDSKVQLNIK